MDDFTNQIQIEEITSTPTQADWAEYHEWLESQEQDDYEQEDDGQPDEYTEWQDLYGGDDWDHGQSEETTSAVTSGADIVMPSRPGWYLVEVAGLARQPESGFMVDYCREASPSDGGGMQWVDNYCHTVVAWYPLPNTTTSKSGRLT